MNKLDIARILPRYSRNGNELFVKANDENLYITYTNQTNFRKVEFSCPKSITLDSKFFEGLGLVIGDGLNNPSIVNTHFNFVNTNADLVKKVYDWLGVFNIENIQFYLIVPIECREVDKIIKHFSIKLGVIENDIKVYKKERTKHPRLFLQTSNPIFQLIYFNLFPNLKNMIFKNKESRRCFLRGLFSAEGHIKHSVYGTPESIIFAFNPKTENQLALFVRECLERENICAKIKTKQNMGIVYFTDYNNMLRFYLTGCMGGSKEKRIKFLKLLSHAKIDIHFKNEVLDYLKKNQSETAKLLECSQANISKMIKRKSATIDHLKKLQIFPKIVDDLKGAIGYVTISNCHVKERKLIELLVNLGSREVIM